MFERICDGRCPAGESTPNHQPLADKISPARRPGHASRPPVSRLYGFKLFCLPKIFLPRLPFLGYSLETMVSVNFANAFSFSYWYWGFFASMR